jgi:hypothetical protein
MALGQGHVLPRRLRYPAQLIDLSSVKPAGSPSEVDDVIDDRLGVMLRADGHRQRELGVELNVTELQAGRQRRTD